jgi:hypothetical protein
LDYSATNLDFCQDLNACNVVGNGDLFGTILFQENGDMDWQDVGLLNSFEFDTYESSFMTVELWLTGNSGMFVDRFGCAYDSDNDGICDVSDKCHDMSACNYLNTNDEYCFPDTDVDGVCDNLDGCYAVSACNYLDPVTSICSYASDVCDDGNNNTLDDVFDTNCICSGNFTLEIGQTYQGGSIAYIFQSSDPGYVEGEIHGLIASDFDIGVFNWGCYGVGFENYDIPGAEGFILGTGAQNTIDIVNAGCGGAAQACADLELNGYSDWFLPSIMELNLLWQNRYLIGGFQDANYWSSTEEVSWGAMYFMFGLGGPGDSETNEFYLVRPIRVF